jgi:hypothetical protein
VDLDSGLDGGADSGTDAGPEAYFIGPGGDDDNPGTRAAPFATFSKLFSVLEPGTSGMLLDGTYGSGTASGPFHLSCGDNSTTCEGVPCRHGDIGDPITLRADQERQARVQGDPQGTARGMLLRNCDHYSIGGIVFEGVDSAAVVGQTKGAAMALEGVANLRVEGVIARLPNRYLEMPAIAVLDSENVLIEGAEVYDFHADGIRVVNSASVTLRRTYLNSRDRMDLFGGFVTEYPLSGDRGVRADPGSTNIRLENTIDEKGGMIFIGVQGLTILGSISMQAQSSGLYIGSTEDQQPPISNIVVQDLVVLDSGGHGIYARSPDDVTLEGISAFNSDGDSVSIDNDWQPPSCGACRTVTTDLTFRRIHAQNAGEDGIDIDTHNAYGTLVLEDLNAVGSQVDNFETSEPLTRATEIDGDLGDCRVYIPNGSPLQGATPLGGDIGANLIFQLEDGNLTADKLWQGTDRPPGQFPCGAVVSGINDGATFPNDACVNVHERLNVGQGNCPLP